MNEIKIFSPASIANVSCGFDVLGLCLDSVGDEMIFRKTQKKGIFITKIEGAELPYETNKNVAGVSAQAVYDSVEVDFGIEIEIYKKIKAGSGIGSSSASASGSAFGVNEILGRPYSLQELVPYAMKGEELASGSLHADNVAPVLLGGCTLIRSYTPLDVLKIPVPSELYATIIHPHIEVKTKDARKILKPTVTLKNAIQQWGNVGAFVSGMYTNDYELIARSLEDVVVEPIRSILIPKFKDLIDLAKKSGGLGGGISGSGPSVFALNQGKENAEKVKESWNEFYKNVGISYDIYVTKINEEGIKIL
ncbi:MAG: homoserine kinase [Flavobacteriales bacterium]|nr:homoserine kinase [Flavobacteriales bacterium]